jgi:hypothetical protein
MTMTDQGGGFQVPAAMREVRTARTIRRILAVPFWALLVLCLVSWPYGSVVPSGAWKWAGVLGPVPLVPVAAARTIRFLGVVRGRNGASLFGPGCNVALRLFFGTCLLTAAADVLAPMLVPTTAVTATVAECHRASSDDTRSPAPARGLPTAPSSPV